MTDVEKKYMPYYLHALFNKISPALAKTYLSWFSLINFAFVFLLGRLLSHIVQSAFAQMPILGVAFGTIAEIFWLWIMTVGAFGHFWGFPKLKREKVKASKTENVETVKTKEKIEDEIPFMGRRMKNSDSRASKPRKQTERKKIKFPPFVINLMMLFFGFLMLIMSQWFSGYITLGFALCGVFLIIASVKGGLVPKKKKVEEKK